MSVGDKLRTFTAERIAMLLLAIGLVVWLCVSTCGRGSSGTVTVPDVAAADSSATAVGDTVDDADSDAKSATVAKSAATNSDTVAPKRKRKHHKRNQSDKAPAPTRDYLKEPIGD